jgi:glycosyltransferase involved in cell wall biosynthesis
MKPTLSVVMASFNGHKYIIDQIESILSQSLHPDEIVISDDASTDDTPKILNQYLSKYPNYFIVNFQHRNLGYIKNFEQALSLAKGDLIAFSDQDDIWLRDKLAQQVAIMAEDPSVGLVFSDLCVTNQDLKTKYKSFWHSVLNFNEKGKLTADFYQQLLGGNVVTGATILAERSLLHELIPFPDGIPHDWWIATTASLIKRLYALEERTVLYRQHQDNILGSDLGVINYQRYISRLEIFDHFLNYLDSWCQRKETFLMKLQPAPVSVISQTHCFYTHRSKLYRTREIRSRVSAYGAIRKSSRRLPDIVRNHGKRLDRIALFSPRLAICVENFLQKALLSKNQ